MIMVLTTDVYFEQEPQPGALIAATAVAFGVPTSTVVVAPLVSDVAHDALYNPTVTVLWRREPGDQPGDFPDRYQLAIPEEAAETIFDHLAVVAARLGVPFVTEASHDAELHLYFPDGTVHTIADEASHDDDYAIRLRPHDRAALDRAIETTPHAIAN